MMFLEKNIQYKYVRYVILGEIYTYKGFVFASADFYQADFTYYVLAARGVMRHIMRYRGMHCFVL